jgi:hypothetical protein
VAAKILMVLSASIVFALGAIHLVYTFSGPELTPRDPCAASGHESGFACHYEGNNNVAVLGGLQCKPQHGTYFVRLSFRISRIRSRPTPLSSLRFWDGAHPGVHLFFVLQQIAQGRLAQHLVDGHLHGAPQRAHGAIHRARADGRLAGVAVAEIAFEERPPSASITWPMTMVPAGRASV